MEENSNERRKSKPKWSFLFLTVLFAGVGAFMFAMYARAVDAQRIYNANRVVTATFVDIEETPSATVPSKCEYTAYTLVFEYVDADGTLYGGTERVYDTEALARSHLGETKRIRIDGNGNYLDAATVLAEWWDTGGILVIGLIWAALAVFFLLLAFTPLKDAVSAFGSKLSEWISGPRGSVAANVLFIFLLFALVFATGFFVSGLNGFNGVEARNRLIQTGKRVDAAIVCISDVRTTSRSTKDLMGWNFIYEYVDRQNGDTVYTGTAGFLPVRIDEQELNLRHRETIGQKIEIIIDGHGNSLLASASPENPVDNAYFWVGIGLYAVSLSLLTAYLFVRFKRQTSK